MTVARYWREQKNRYNLLGTKCGNCGRSFFPPREICIDCHRKSIGQMENVKFKGTGKVLSYSIVHESNETFKPLVPYTIAIIELDEGVRVTAQVVNAENHSENNSNSDPTKRENEITIGSKVKCIFRKISEDGKSGIIHYGYKFKLKN